MTADAERAARHWSVYEFVRKRTRRYHVLEEDQDGSQMYGPFANFRELEAFLAERRNGH